MRKPDFVACKQQRHRPACAFTLTDQHVCYSLPWKYHIKTCFMQNFNILAILCSWAGWFEHEYLDPGPWVDWGGGTEAKIKLFQNMVKLHIKLMRMTMHAASWYQIFCTSPDTRAGQKVKIQLFQKMVMLHIKLNGMTNAATCKHIFCPYTYSRPLGGIKGQNIFILKVVMLLKGMEHRAPCKHIFYLNP